MKTVFDAENSLEAHMIAGMLEQQGIGAWVLGDTLQGGTGELPAGSLVRVVTNDDQADRAREILHEWERHQPDEGSTVRSTEMARPRGIGAFLLGLIAGASITLLFVLQQAR